MSSDCYETEGEERKEGRRRGREKMGEWEGKEEWKKMKEIRKLGKPGNSRFTHHVSRITFYVLRFTFYVSRFTSERGLSLIATLWIVTILSVLATQFLYSIRLERRARENFVERMVYHYAAKAGFEKSIAMLRGDTTPYDALGEDWAKEIEEQIEDGIHMGKALTYRIKITDEGSKVNINTADVNMIRGLLNRVGYEETATTEQPLAEAIVQGRPYRTVRDLAKVQGMTQEILYGNQQTTTETAADDSEGQNAPGLINFVTAYSIDKNTDANGGQRVNINSANAQQLTQIQGSNNQAVFTQGETQSLIQQRQFNGIGALLDAQAVSNQIFDNIRDRLSIDSDAQNQQLVNINTADANRLQSLNGIDQGIAQRIIDHRNSQGNFQNIDQLKDVKLITDNEFRSIVDKITTLDEAMLRGLININTAPQEILQLLPGMDETKAGAIITRRESQPENNQQSQVQGQEQSEVEGNPFTDIGQLMDVEGIDMNTFRQIAGLVTYRGYGFMIEASGVDSMGKTIASCVGAIDRSGQRVTITYWKQD
ncbi:helix-hairpin-helix domain-containing protein [Candidatus Poribacteria bacterium]|nr:helix-hairpin-helix domain-containing protein [Candidatus Poribacteria bacterium]